MDLDQDSFLAGPDGEPGAIAVDDILGKTLERAVREMVAAGDPAAFAVDPEEPVTRSLVDPTLLFVTVECGTLLIDADGRIIGGMIDCDLVLDATFHDRGLGREIVVEHVLRQGDIPVWYHDTPGYTRAGARTVRSAHAWLSDPANLAGKQADLALPAARQPVPPAIDLAPFRPAPQMAQETPPPAV